MIRFTLLAAATSALLSACARHPPLPPAHPHYLVGDPVLVDGEEWFYPRLFADYDATGLSTLTTNDPRTLTADGEDYDAKALAAASLVLPLPSIVRITNLANGLTLEVRVNDRGPPQIGRVIAVTPRVARLLDMPKNGVAEVEVQLDTQKTNALQGALGAGPAVTAAPVAAITATNLAPPGETGPASATQTLGPTTDSNQDNAAATLDGEVTQGSPSPGPLWVQMGAFGRPRDADQTEQRLYGLQPEIVPLPGNDRTLYAIRIGPYDSVDAADSALRDVLSRGVADPEIVVR